MENTPLRIEKYLAPDLVAILMVWIEAKCTGWDGETKGAEIAFMLSRWQQPERNTLLAWRVYRERGVASVIVCLAAGDDDLGVEVWNERDGWLADATQRADVKLIWKLIWQRISEQEGATNVDAV